MVFYIIAGKLHYGMILHNDKNELVLKEGNNVRRKKASQVAWEVSNECRRLGLERISQSSNRQGMVRCKGDKEQL